MRPAAIPASAPTCRTVVVATFARRGCQWTGPRAWVSIAIPPIKVASDFLWDDGITEESAGSRALKSSRRSRDRGLSWLASTSPRMPLVADRAVLRQTLLSAPEELD